MSRRNPVRAAKARLRTRLRTVAGEPELRGRIDEAEQRHHDELARRGDRLLEEFRARIDAVEEHARVRLNRQLRRLEEHERELNRLSPQVAALEERLERLREWVEYDADGPAASAAPVPRSEAPGESTGVVAEFARLQAEVRRQHAQVRARISAAARFEERLRRVEDAVEGQRAVQPPST